MKARFSLLIMVLGILFMMPQSAKSSGNDYLEKDYHYMAYSMGTDQ